MLSAGIPEDKQSVSSALSTDQRIQNYFQLIEQGAPAAEIQAAELGIAEALKQQPFEIKQQLPFFQQLVKKLDASNAFQQFKLPGRDKVVVDRREEPSKGKPEEAAKKDIEKTVHDKKAEAKEKSKEAAAEMRLHEGKLVKHKERTWTNFLGDRNAARGGLEREAASKQVERLLSAFEQMVIERFENGKKIAQETEGGKPKFLEKTEAQWKQFFQAFLQRTVQKKILLSEIRDFLLRGLISKGNKGIVIGDINLNNGHIEKFVRFSILAEALAKLKAMVPGDAFGKGVLGQLTGEELMYLALAASRGREYAASMLPTHGKFVGGKAEAQAAEALGIPLDAHLRQKAKTLRGRRSGGLFSGDLLGEGKPEELPYQFIPWWHWGNLSGRGKLKWVTAVFYGSLLAISLIGIAMLTWRILGG